MLYKPSMSKLIIGSRRTRITGETIVPGAPHEPAKACSPTPSTRPNEPKLIYKQPWHQKKPAKESFKKSPFTPESSKDSTNSTTSTIAAASAAQQAKQTTIFEINTMPILPPFYVLSSGECGGRSAEEAGCFASHLTATTAKKNISAGPRGPPHANRYRDPVIRVPLIR